MTVIFNNTEFVIEETGMKYIQYNLVSSRTRYICIVERNRPNIFHVLSQSNRDVGTIQKLQDGNFCQIFNGRYIKETKRNTADAR